MRMPTAEAIQWVEATTPKVPQISGRVVKARIGFLRNRFVMLMQVVMRVKRSSRHRKSRAIAKAAGPPIYSRVGDASGVPISGLARMDASMPLDFPPDTTLS